MIPPTETNQMKQDRSTDTTTTTRRATSPRVIEVVRTADTAMTTLASMATSPSELDLIAKMTLASFRRVFSGISPMSEFPEWLPEPVIAWIEENRDYPEHVRDRNLIHQLATDPRAKTTWTELTKKQRGDFIYQVRMSALEQFCEPPIPDNEDVRHGIGLIFFFKQILHISISVRAAKTEAEREAQAEDMRQRAVWLRTEAYDTDQTPNGVRGINWHVVADAMRAKADLLYEKSNQLAVNDLVVPHARENMRGLSTASRISGVIETLFGSPFYRQSAAIAGLLTGETVTMEQVRDLQRKYKGSVKFLPRKR
jgi:hypothetical protein